MKFVRYSYGKGENKIGLVSGDGIIELAAAYQHMEGKGEEAISRLLSGEMEAFIKDYDRVAGAVKAVQKESLNKPPWLPETLVSLKDAVVAAPLANPGKIVCIGLNYEDHAKEGGNPIPKEPVIFGKYANSIVGPEEAIRIPPVTEKVDYEAELAVVIGKKTRRVNKDDVLDHIFGYMNFNDVSARDLQRRDGQWMKGKFLDTFAPTGPFLVTGEEIGDPANLNIALRLNGKTMQSSNTGNMIFSIPKIISFVSQLATLEPGDIIATGTPAGCGYARTPPVFLRPGDNVEVEIQNLGILKNPVIQD